MCKFTTIEIIASCHQRKKHNRALTCRCYSLNTQHSSHNNGDYVFDDSLRIVDPHLADSQTGLPRSPRRSEVSQNHAWCSTDVSTEKKNIVQASRGCEAKSTKTHATCNVEEGDSCPSHPNTDRTWCNTSDISKNPYMVYSQLEGRFTHNAGAQSGQLS